nr:unnamed protein product [Digitaria exilis]
MFMAHKVVLAARSSVFMAVLFGGQVEENAAVSHVKVDDMDPDVFGAMLYFIYTDTLPEVDDGDAMVMAQHLLVAADKLKLICEDKLCGYIDSKTVVTMLVLADRHGCRCLQEACVRFLKSRGNLKSILASGDFEHLTRSYPSLLKELLAKVTQ